MGQPQFTIGLFSNLPTCEEVEIRLTENAREKRLLQQLLKVTQQRDSVEHSAADVKRNRERLGQGTA